MEVQICLEFDFNLASVSNFFSLHFHSLSLKTISQFHVCKIRGKIWQHKKVISHKNMNTQKLQPNPKCWKLKPSKMLPHVRIWQVTLHSQKKKNLNHLMSRTRGITQSSDVHDQYMTNTSMLLEKLIKNDNFWKERDVKYSVMCYY